MVRRKGSFWLLVATLLLGACQASPPSQEGKKAGANPPLLPTTGGEFLKKAKDGSAPVTLVDAWATWCGPCREKFPHILRLKAKYETDGLRVLLISVDDPSDRKDVLRFLKEHDVSFPTFMRKEKVMEFLRSFHPAWSGTLPAAFLFDDKGTLHSFWEGDVDVHEVEKTLTNLLARPPKKGKTP